MFNRQAIVDNQKQFLDLYMKMPYSTNDSRMLRQSSLFHLATRNNLFVVSHSIVGFQPYLLANSGYPFLPCLMVLHKGNGIHGTR